MSDTFTTEIKDNNDAWLTFNRPDVHNALDEDMIVALDDEMKRLGDDPTVRSIIFSGAGKSFCAGGDLNWMRRSADFTYDENIVDATKLADMLSTMNTVAKPTVALVQGAAFGGGVGVVACCDIVVAAPNAKFCLSEAKLGLVAAVISPYVLAAMGESWMRRYAMTSDVFRADDALRCGLVHTVTDDLHGEGMRLAEVLSKNGPKAMAGVKDLIGWERNRPIDDAVLKETSKRIAEVRASDEGQEGVTAFLEKRTPSWRGE